MRIHFACVLITLVLLGATSLSNAQNTSNNQSPTTYKTFDPSKSLPGNLDHDKAHFLIVNSVLVELPTSVVAYLDSIEQPVEYSGKVKSAQMAWLRILYNPEIRKEDKVFIHERLKLNSEDYIQSILHFFQTNLKD